MGRLVRIAERVGAPIAFELDGRPATARAGDSIAVAILANAPDLRDAEFDGGRRAGFCLMGACQDCWVWLEPPARVRACTTELRPGMRIRTRAAAGKA